MIHFLRLSDGLEAQLSETVEKCHHHLVVCFTETANHQTMVCLAYF